MTARDHRPATLQFRFTFPFPFVTWAAVGARFAASSCFQAVCLGAIIFRNRRAREFESPSRTHGYRKAVLPVRAVLGFLLPLATLTFPSDGLFAQETSAAAERRAGSHHVQLRVDRLTCRIGGNRALGEHRAGYNGVFSMVSPDQTENIFVQTFAGINLENFFDARPRHPDHRVFFEPRSHPMTLRAIDATTVELYQPATPYFGIESRMRFELTAPYYVDYTYTCIPHKADLAGGFFGVFWASYINAPHNKSVYFLAEDASVEQPFWEQMLSQLHDRDSTWRSRADRVELAFQGDTQALWRAISPLRFSAPFFYGRYRNMVLIYIFRPGPTVRFAISPSGGGRSQEHHQRNPAWDFQMIVPDYRVGQAYRLEMRAVYKRWEGRTDVLDQVQRYLGG